MERHEQTTRVWPTTGRRVKRERRADVMCDTKICDKRRCSCLQRVETRLETWEGVGHVLERRLQRLGEGLRAESELRGERGREGRGGGCGERRLEPREGVEGGERRRRGLEEL